MSNKVSYKSLAAHLYVGVHSSLNKSLNTLTHKGELFKSISIGRKIKIPLHRYLSPMVRMVSDLYDQ